VYVTVLGQDVEYKTLSIDRQTTSGEVVELVLRKFRLAGSHDHEQKDYYLSMEFFLRQGGRTVSNELSLDDNSYPAQLQASYPLNHTRFKLMRRDGNV